MIKSSVRQGFSAQDPRIKIQLPIKNVSSCNGTKFGSRNFDKINHAYGIKQILYILESRSTYF